MPCLPRARMRKAAQARPAARPGDQEAVEEPARPELLLRFIDWLLCADRKSLEQLPFFQLEAPEAPGGASPASMPSRRRRAVV